MNKKIIILSIVAIFIIFGFVMGMIFDSRGGGCTEMACNCFDQLNEIPCNRCTSMDQIFKTFIINVDRYCESREIILCKNNERIGKRFDKTTCEYKIKFFGI